MWRLPLRNHRRFGVRGPTSRELMTQRREMARSFVSRGVALGSPFGPEMTWNGPASSVEGVDRSTPMGAGQRGSDDTLRRTLDLCLRTDAPVNPVISLPGIPSSTAQY